MLQRTRELARANDTLTDLNRQLETLSNTDSLLGIANRRYFDETLEREWRRAMRRPAFRSARKTWSPPPIAACMPAKEAGRDRVCPG